MHLQQATMQPMRLDCAGHVGTPLCIYIYIYIHIHMWYAQPSHFIQQHHFGLAKKWRKSCSASAPSLLALCQAVCHAALAPPPLCLFSLGAASFLLGAAGGGGGMITLPCCLPCCCHGGSFAGTIFGAGAASLAKRWAGL